MRMARRLRVEAVEITLGSFDMVLNFRPSEAERAWLRSLPYVSIHAPLFDGAGRDGGAARRVLAALERLYESCRASNLVVHPDRLPDASWLRETPCEVSMENLAPEAGFPAERLAEALEAHPRAGLCLDLSHAFAWGDGHAEELLRRFGGRLRQVHASASADGRTHLRLKDASGPMRDFFGTLAGLGKPCLLEEDVAEMGEAEEDLAVLSALLGR